MIPNEKMLAVKEVAEILGVGPDTIRRMIRNGSLRAVRLPKCGGKGKNITYRIKRLWLNHFTD